MGRFDRDNIGTEELSASLDNATEELRATVERQLREIVTVAEAKAVEIQDGALEKAKQIERESMLQRGEVFEAGVNRAYQMLEAIDALEQGVAKVIATLRYEAENLTSELEAARTAASSAAGPTEPEARASSSSEASTDLPAAPDEETSENGGEDDWSESDVATDETFPIPEAADEQGGGGTPEVRDMVRLQLVTLRQSGKPRVDAERFLMRFKQSDKYVDLLDEIYDQDDEDDQDDESKTSPSRRRRLRRRRTKQESGEQE